jgi:hypothetical protein
MFCWQLIAAHANDQIYRDGEAESWAVGGLLADMALR